MTTPPDPVRGGATLTERIDYLTAGVQFLIVETIALGHSMEATMATVAELQSALDRNTAATSAAATAIQTEIDQLKAAVGALSTATPPTQAQLDQLNASSSALEQATAALATDDTAAPPVNPG